MAPAKGKKVAPAPFATRKNAPAKAKANTLFESKPRKFGIGQNVQPPRNLSRFIKWPKYVRLPAPAAGLRMRLRKVPPCPQPVLTHTLDSNKARELFKLSPQVPSRVQEGEVPAPQGDRREGCQGRKGRL